MFYNNDKIIVLLLLQLIMRNFYFPEPSFLMLITLGKIFSRPHIEILSLFCQENRFRYFMQCSMKTNGMKCQTLLSGKNKEKIIINVSSAELAQRR